MCGFSSIISLSSKKISEPDLIKMSESMIGRGPDSTGTFVSVDRKIGLSIRRLSTQDPSRSADQPVFSFDRKVVLVFNGEIYNHQDLRKELENSGYKFTSNNDAEVLANGIHKYGSKILDKIKGQFAFLSYDRQKEKIFAARDKLGICPFYYSIRENKIFISSTIFSLKLLFNLKFHKNALVDFFVSDAVSNGKTFYENINYLEPGHYFEFKKGQQPKKFSFLEKLNDYPLNLSKNQIKRFIKNNIESNLDSCLKGDKKVCTYLSGGLDSMLLTYLIKENYKNFNFKTFTVCFNNEFEKFSSGESHLNKNFLNQNNINHETCYINHHDLKKEMGLFDQPIASFIEIAIKQLSLRAKKSGFNVALSGEGADEAFVGYDHYFALIGSLDKKYKYLLKNYQLRSNFYKSLNRNILLEDIFLGGGANIDLNKNLKNLFISSKIDFNNYKKYFRKICSSIKKIKNPLNKAIFFDYYFKVPENLLRRAEGPSMNNSVELRFPFLNYDLVKFMYKVPLKYKIGLGDTKNLLRESFKKLAPKEVIEMPKSPFALSGVKSSHYENAKINFGKPAFYNFFNRNYKNFQELIMDSSLSQKKILNVNYFRKRLNLQKNPNKCFFDGILWKFCSLAKWYENNF